MKDIVHTDDRLLTSTAVRPEPSGGVETSVALESADVSLADTSASRLIAVITHRPVHVTAARCNIRVVCEVHVCVAYDVLHTRHCSGTCERRYLTYSVSELNSENLIYLAKIRRHLYHCFFFYFFSVRQ